MTSRRSGFAGRSNKQGGAQQPKGTGSNISSPTGFSPMGGMGGYNNNMDSNNSSSDQLTPEPPKFFFQEKYAKLGVKGNFMPLAAQPKNVDLGDWLAHQAVEQYKNVDNIVACIQEVDQKTGLPLCNSRCCPVMSAGRSHTYTWLNHAKEPVKVPAQQYISLVQRWIVGKLSDNKTFPTDPLTNASSSFPITSPSPSTAMSPIPTGPTSLTAPLSELSGHDWVGKATGFPENFFTDCKTIFRQIFRVYAHVYHSHWVDPFWHIHNSNPPSSGWTDLNSCFVHFVTVAKLFGLLTEKDLEPMQPLVDIWIANGSIPPDAANGVCAVVPGHY